MIKRLDVIVLGLLTTRPRTGYDVRKWLDTYGRGVGYSAPSSQIYRQLARLEDRGWAESVIDPRSSGPDAKLYTLTDAGRRAFDEWATAPYEPAPRPMDPDFQVRMTFTRHLGPEALLDLVRTELRFRREQHQHAMPYDPSLLPEDASPQELAWSQEVCLLGSQRGRLLVSTFITWLETTEARLALLVENQRHGLGSVSTATPAQAHPSTRTDHHISDQSQERGT
jgi:DNA-binding PadR family transcriptional regulator